MSAVRYNAYPSSHISHNFLEQSSTSLSRSSRTPSPELPDCDLCSDEPPQGLKCPLTGRIFKDPVYTKCQHVFDRYALELLLGRANPMACPSCYKWIHAKEVRPHEQLLQLIKTWQSGNPRVRNEFPDLPKIEMESTKTPDEFLCPIDREVMENPVFIKRCKHVFENSAIRRWLDESDGVCPCPCCRDPFSIDDLKPWPQLKKLFEQWKIAPKVSKEKNKNQPAGAGPKPQPVKKNDRVTSGNRLGQSSAKESIHVVKSLIKAADRFAMKNGKKIPDFKTLPSNKATKKLEAYFSPIFHYVYRLHMKRTGTTSHDPKFGRKAFFHKDHLDVSQTIRQQAIYLCAFKHLIKLFQQPLMDAPTRKVFSTLPKELRKGTYKEMHKLLRKRNDGKKYHSPDSGRNAFHRVHGYFSSREERVKAMTNYLKSRV